MNTIINLLKSIIHLNILPNTMFTNKNTTHKNSPNFGRVVHTKLE